MKSIALYCITTACAVAMAAMAKPAAAQDIDANATLRIATGAKGKGFSRVFSDLQTVCGGQVSMSEVPSEGGLQNLTILAANRADLGFAQLDTLREMKTSDEAIAQLLAVTALNSNLLHVVVRNTGFPRRGPIPLGFLDSAWLNQPVDTMADLKGKPVAVVGSARSVGRTLDREFGLSLRFQDVETDEEALAKLKAGAVAAMMTSSGWPNGPVQRLKRADGLRLLKFDLPAKAPVPLMRKNYENLDAFNVDFLASPNLLVTRPFTQKGPKGRAVAALQACIARNLTQLQEGDFEPAWREVRASPGLAASWPIFSAAVKR